MKYNKYHNNKTEIDGIVFDSRLETSRYKELKLLERAGTIKDLELQLTFELIPAFKKNKRTFRKTTYKADFKYFDNEKNEKYIPYVIEPSLGADRVVLAFLCAAYDEENIGTEEKPDVRTVLHFHPALAPVKIGVLPLSKKLNEGAEKVYAELSKYYNCEFDDRGNIGKRYRRQDEIGTPFCVTYDFDSEEDGAVTVRDRDTMEQERIKIDDLKAYFEKKFEW